VPETTLWPLASRQAVPQAFNRSQENARFSARALVVDDEPSMRTAVAASFMQRGWQVDTATGPAEALVKFESMHHRLVISDIRMPDGDGFDVMRRIRAIEPRTGFILLTAFANVPDAISAVKSGACEYLVKPVDYAELERVAQQLCRNPLPGRADDFGLIGHSPALRRALERAQHAAASDADILIEAESGCGKELLARMIHRLSPRRERPFIALNCAAFPEALLESELFGHVRGAFTGAAVAKPGKFELAHGGTLLLDEIAELPLVLQPKLLRALQEREFDRLGGTRSLKVDIRVIATTNRSLETMIREGQFRADLYYRLNVIPLTLPPLRERREDIAELARYFAAQYAPAGLIPPLSGEFLNLLQQHSWPGNVRELANLMRRAIALGSGEIGIEAIGSSELDGRESPELLHGVRKGQMRCNELRAGLSLPEVERRLIELTLESTAGNRSRAAEMLGVSLRTIRNKVREYGLPPRKSYVSH